MNEHYEAMLVDLRISCWTARKQDKKVSREVAQNHGTSEQVGSYYKSLVDSPELTAISRITNETRAAHYRWTLPWLDSGPRVLPSKAYMDYIAEMDDLRMKYNAAVESFLAVYDQRKTEARTVLGTLFNESDYPPMTAVQAKFGFNMHVLPVPAGNDFRCDIGDAEVERIRQEITATTQSAMSTAVESLYARIADVVGAFVDRLSDDDNVFRDSLVGNARELVAILPKLNLTNDPGIDDLCVKIKAALCTFEPKQLREDLTVRGMVKTRADTINDALKDYMKGMYGKDTDSAIAA